MHHLNGAKKEKLETLDHIGFLMDCLAPNKKLVASFLLRHDRKPPFTSRLGLYSDKFLEGDGAGACAGRHSLPEAYPL